MLRPKSIVVIGTDRAAKIATARARAINPESRIVVFEAGDEIALDMDARTITSKADEKSECIHFDALIFSGGTQGEPDLRLLTDVGAIVTKDGTLFVDDTMCTSLESVYACGNAISVMRAVSHRRDYALSPSMIERSAQVAGSNAASTLMEHLDRVRPCAGAEVTREGEKFVGCTGQRAQELSKGEFVRASATAYGRTLTLFASNRTGAIVGGEISGDALALRFLDVISLSVVKGLSANDLIDLDVASDGESSGPELLREVASQIKSALLREKVAQWLAEHGERTLEILLQSN